MANTETAVVEIREPGTPGVLQYSIQIIRQPGPGQVLIDQKAIGVNFLDVFFRNGTFPLDAYPAPIGMEAAGVIAGVGENVMGFEIGDRVAYFGSPGAYAEKRLLGANELFKLPADISFEQAASLMTKGLTAHMLIKQSHEVKAGQTVLVHATAGGVGTLLSEWCRALGATVIGTVGSAAKKELVLKRGFRHVVDLASEDFAAVVNAVTAGTGVDAVYDGTGAATFQKSLPLIKVGGSAVLYGWPSGMPDIDMELIQKRKLHLVRAILNNYPPYQDKTGKAMAAVFDLVRRGIFNVADPAVYPLAEAAKAHADLESRKTTGSLILKP